MLLSERAIPSGWPWLVHVLVHKYSIAALDYIRNGHILRDGNSRRGRRAITSQEVLEGSVSDAFRGLICAVAATAIRACASYCRNRSLHEARKKVPSEIPSVREIWR